MLRHLAVRWIAPCSLLLCATTTIPAQEPAATSPSPATTGPLERTARPRVLFVTQSRGFTHPVVKRLQAGKASFAGKKLVEMARPFFDVDLTADASTLTKEKLADYRAVVFYTTGELPLDAAAKRDFLQWVRSGGGFVGIHCATDTFYQWPDYGRMIGGYFDGHPWHQAVRMRVEDRSHPATAVLGPTWTLKDEIYQFRSWSRDHCNVLLTLDPTSVNIDKGKRTDGDYANAWWRNEGEGRVFYTALGHRFEVWNDRVFQRHLLGGLRWAMNAEAEFGRPPADARVLVTDRGVPSGWTKADGQPIGWRTENGALVVQPGTGDIISEQAIGDCRLHVEFRLPPRIDGRRGQARGNSGVYIQRRYEVQILDSFEEPPTKNGCAALYRQRSPDANRCSAPGEWQAYDIRFRAARFDEGQKIANATITVVHNGVIVHDGVELTGKTGAGKPEAPAPGPLLLQDHGSRVAYRNVWFAPY